MLLVGIMKSISAKNKELILFKGTLIDFATMLLTDRRGDGSVICLGEIHEIVVKELSKKGVQLVDTRIIVDQHAVTKYFTHPKNKKGAALPIEDYELIETAAKRPQKIYEDASHGELVYIYSYPYKPGKILKLVVQPNYSRNGKTYNNIKSWGIIQSANLNNPAQYRLIWTE